MRSKVKDFCEISDSKSVISLKYNLVAGKFCFHFLVLNVFKHFGPKYTQTKKVYLYFQKLNFNDFVCVISG